MDKIREAEEAREEKDTAERAPEIVPKDSPAERSRQEHALKRRRKDYFDRDNP